MTELEKLKMDDEYIAQNDIAQRYLQNKLTPEETVEFEEYILDKPELLERLELDMVLVETLPEVESTEPQKHQKIASPLTSILEMIFSSRLKASLATGLACAFIAILIVPQVIVSRIQHTGNIELFYLSDVRGIDDFEQKFGVAKSADTLIFVLEAEFKEDTPYIVSLTNTGNSAALPLADSYLPSEVDEIYISIHAQDLPKGSYQFEYHPANDKSETRSSQFVIE